MMCSMCQEPAHCGRATQEPNPFGITNAMHDCRCRACVQELYLGGPSLSLGLSLSSRPTFTMDGDTWAEVREGVRQWLVEEDAEPITAICALVHGWRSGVGSADEAMEAISKLLHEVRK
jgi:hypothetical protein